VPTGLDIICCKKRVKGGREQGKMNALNVAVFCNWKAVSTELDIIRRKKRVKGGR
jgi:hypothetical protein